jgi:succinate dehydrogenase/fumarate reductase flavoprotein subunit
MFGNLALCLQSSGLVDRFMQQAGRGRRCGGDRRSEERMKETELKVGDGRVVPMTWVHTLVIGSGAAGLNAAVQLRANGIEDVLIVTEGLDMGTSINTGSDKQTYYKLSLCGDEPDSPVTLADSYFSGGSMHGDLALVEASLSARAFIHLVNLGVPFPRDAFGQFVGYKTDHDPRQRATSIGPYTSREMCRALIRRIGELAVPVREGQTVAQLLTVPDGSGGQARAAGALAVTAQGGLEAYGAENVVLAVGGPGGLYKTSVYPEVHTGGIGLALMAGAKAQGLPESQYGLASTGFRWNVSGTYMQVVPRFISTAHDGTGDAREFLREYFISAGEMHSKVFLKGYQWPFDARKVLGGSSIVDILVYLETVRKKRRVFLDFRGNPEGFDFAALSPEAREYLEKSGALQGTPIERLRHMNPGAIELYRDHGVDISAKPLEIAVCAQHNNGGLAGNHWWESVNIRHLFPVGEVNGSHGVYRPGGSALNAGQVGGFRAAEFMANRYRQWTVEEHDVEAQASASTAELLDWLSACRVAGTSWQEERGELQERMTRAGAHIRSAAGLEAAVAEARSQWARVRDAGCGYAGVEEAREAAITRTLSFTHAVYLDAVRFAVASGVGSRGSAIVVDPSGTPVHERLDETWRIVPEDECFKANVLETEADADGGTRNTWVDRRPVPQADAWFETAWARFRDGVIYDA